ncbi:MAG TPA: hypothetical protein VGB07_36785 [Blastocatellia bacterium]
MILELAEMVSRILVSRVFELLEQLFQHRVTRSATEVVCQHERKMRLAVPVVSDDGEDVLRFWLRQTLTNLLEDRDGGGRSLRRRATAEDVT